MHQSKEELQGRKLPPEMGSTGDDRMDIANAIGADIGLNLWQSLEIAERVLMSKWYEEVRAKINA